MRTGMIGLGRMGLNMAQRLLQGGHKVVAYNRTTPKMFFFDRLVASLRREFGGHEVVASQGGKN